MRLILILCVILPSICQAQCWNAIVKAGALWNSQSSKPVTNEHGSSLNAMGAIGATYRKGPWEAGAAVGLYSYAFRLKGDFVFGPEPVTGRYTTEYHSFSTRVPAMVFMPFINRHFDIDSGRLSWYAGIAPAYASFMDPAFYEHKTGENKTTGTDGYALQIQGGCTYRLSEAISVFGEPAVGVVNMPGFYGRMYMMYLSLAVGLHIGLK